MKLGNQQEEAFKLVCDWLKSGDKNYFVLSGYAGTGKTTLAKYIADTIGQDDVVFCAYTGKAASVLKEKGCQNSGTIHSYLYKYIGNDSAGKPIFERVPIDECELRVKQLVICDEYSMLPDDILKDLLAMSKKILFLGDNFQLPPVKGECSLVPDFTLTEVQRQALDSGIIRAATALRTDKKISYTKENDFIYLPKSKIERETYFQVEQCIVGKNKTRVKWNDIFRQEKFGSVYKQKIEWCQTYSNGFPLCQAGDKVICLKNNRERGVYNGLIAECTYYNEMQGISIDDGSQTWELLPDYDGAWMEEKPDLSFVNRDICVFDFAYAITCHKSQGSEFESVLISNENFGNTPEERVRWTYTAITRARKLCYLMEPNA